MRIVIPYLLAALCCAFFFSYQKHADADTGGAAVKSKIKTYTQELTTTAGTEIQTYNAAYDNNHRLHYTSTFDSDKCVIGDKPVRSDGAVLKRTYTYY